ncbi:MAG: class I SAM-dependent methyltransferase [Actinomycetota bacterium]
MTEGDRVEIGRAYDDVATLYTELFLDALDHNAHDRDAIDRFAAAMASERGPAIDAGCGAGNVAAHLRARGANALGCDISAGLLGEARHHFPELPLLVGDLSALPLAAAGVGGVLARFSLIHRRPDRYGEVLDEFARVTPPDAPLLMMGFVAESPASHGEPYDHKVTTAYLVHPDPLREDVRRAGFDDVDISTRPPEDGARRGQYTLHARRAAR